MSHHAAGPARVFQVITLKVAAKFRVIPITCIFAPFRGSTQNCAQSHNLKVVGSNPTPATKLRRQVKDLAALSFSRLCLVPASGSTVEARGSVIVGKSRGWRVAATTNLDTNGKDAAVAASRARPPSESPLERCPE